MPNPARYLPAFDFSEVADRSLADRLSYALRMAQARVAESGYQEFCDFPCVPDQGASETELDDMEIDLGVELPAEYRAFLSICRYLKIADGLEIGGFDHEGIFVAEVPWISDKHREGVRYLVFANYGEFGDGDQLMFDLADPARAVTAYLRGHEPRFETFAPSFSLALWRIVHGAGVGGCAEE